MAKPPKWIQSLRAGSSFNLATFDPAQTFGFKDNKETEKRLKANCKRLAELQYRLYAEQKQGLLIVLQGIDSAGKDGTIRKVFSIFNPQGCPVHSFKKPTEEELAHDYLWRIHRAVPGKGQVGIFNRSHYEDVLIVRVHNLVKTRVWKQRFDDINWFEAFLDRNHVRVLKFFLYISKDEQKARFESRLQDPEKNWKFSAADLDERARWDDYIGAFQDVLTRCSPRRAPWYVIPANHKWFRNLAVSEITRRVMEDMDPQFPENPEDLRGIEVL